MKKFITLLLVLTGMVSTASADYYVFYNQDSSYDGHLLATLTDDDGDGVYSAIVNLETAGKLGWGSIEIMVSTSSTFNWTNGTLLWANLDSNKGILDENSFTLSETWSKDGKIAIPVKDATPDTYAIELEYNESTKTFSGTRLIEFASSNDDWHTSNPVYMPETAHNTGIFVKILKLPKDTEFKFVSNNNGGVGWYGNKDNSSIATDGSNITISDNGAYTITANFNSTYVAPVRVTATTSVGAKGYSTYCNSDYALDFSDKSIKAYTISSTNGSSLTLTQKNKIAKNEPVLLYSSTNSDSQTIPTILDSDATADATNKLVKGSGTALTWAVGSEYYVLATATVDPGFYRANNNTVAANKAYLDLRGLSGAHSFSLDLGEENTTGIATINGEKEIMNNAFYNLNGQEVAQPTKGLYIMNGKKVIIK